jgi:hypothetical protein
VPVVFFTTRSATRRALGAAAAIALAAAVRGIRAGPIGLGLPGSRDVLAAVEALLRAAPQALVAEIPAVAFAAVVLPPAAVWLHRFARRAAEARTYTG